MRKFNIVSILILVLFLNIQSSSAFSFSQFFQNIFMKPKVSYKLTYFNIRARAEFLRFMFSYAGQPYEDIRVKAEDWPALRPNQPFQQLPVLEVKRGSQVTIIAQSQAIARYLASQFGLAGKDDIETALIDMYGAQMLDLFNAFNIAFFVTNSTDQLFNTTWPTNLRYFEDRLIKNGNGYLVGKSLKWIDIYLSQLTEFMGNRKSELLERFPRIKRHDTMVRSIPNIAKWIENRPKTDV